MSSSSKHSPNSQIQTYNVMGGVLEGFAVPVGLLRMGESSQLGGGGGVNDFTRMHIPDVTNVDAISHDLYEKLFKLSQYNHEDPPKKNKKTRKNTVITSFRKSKKAIR